MWGRLELGQVQGAVCAVPGEDEEARVRVIPTILALGSLALEAFLDVELETHTSHHVLLPADARHPDLPVGHGLGAKRTQVCGNAVKAVERHLAILRSGDLHRRCKVVRRRVGAADPGFSTRVLAYRLFEGGRETGRIWVLLPDRHRQPGKRLLRGFDGDVHRACHLTRRSRLSGRNRVRKHRGADEHEKRHEGEGKVGHESLRGVVK